MWDHQHLSQQLLNKLRLFEALTPAVQAELKANTLPIAIACSGGPDSIAAALVTKALTHVPLTLLHFNHHLRANEADKDAEFVKKFAKEINADFRLGEWANPSNNETDARNARMEFLHHWEYPLIIFGHHADDCVESLLMRLARGATLEGLIAPRPVSYIGRHAHVRPLINLRKTEIIKTLDELKIFYRIDASNAGCDYLRNRIRNQLLPLWQEIETRDVTEGIIAAQRNLREAYEGLEKKIQQKDIKEKIISAYPPALLPINGHLFLPTGLLFSASRITAPEKEKIIKETQPAYRVWIKDCEKLYVRTWQPGEKYKAFGAPGSRKIKEILNEICGHIEPKLRALWPVVVDEHDRPLWLPGARVAQEAIVPQGAENALELHFSETLNTVSKNDL